MADEGLALGVAQLTLATTADWSAVLGAEVPLDAGAAAAAVAVAAGADVAMAATLPVARRELSVAEPAVQTAPEGAEQAVADAAAADQAVADAGTAVQVAMVVDAAGQEVVGADRYGALLQAAGAGPAAARAVVVALDGVQAVAAAGCEDSPDDALDESGHSREWKVAGRRGYRG